MATPTPSSSPSALTGDPIIDAMTSGYRWTLGLDRTIDWSISGGFSGEVWTSPTIVQQYFGAALDTISYFANVKFNFIGSFSNPSAAASAGSEINAAPSGDTRLFTSNAIWAIGFSPTTARDAAFYTGAHGDVFLNINSEANSLPSYEPGSAGWSLMLHELGHTLGLKHPHDDGGTGHPTLTQLGLADLDIDWATVMSYSDENNWNQLGYSPATPMLLDALALQALYGRNMSTNAGDSTFSIKATNGYVTIWDASGQDRLSAADSDRGWEIFLPDDKISSVVPTNIGYALPLSEGNLTSPHTLFWLLGDIEDVTGSPFSDDIYGSVLNNVIGGGGGADYIDGWQGDDTLSGGDGGDTVFGDLGNDIISDASGDNFLRGEDGNDRITGGTGFDNINGNMGEDTVSGGLNNDWVLGGKDADLVTGEAGNDILNGNNANDWVDGDVGDDTARGGQDNDVIFGQAGSDWLSGDRGDDTISGGAGADTFHSFGEAGLDRVTDFNRAEGDRVLLDPGTTYTVTQVGPDTVVAMGSGGRVILVGVSMASLTADWITVG